MMRIESPKRIEADIHADKSAVFTRSTVGPDSGLESRTAEIANLRGGRGKPTILVAVDFTPASMKAAEYAFAWAKRLQASVLLLHVLDPVHCSSFVNLLTREKVRREARQRAWNKINTLATSWMAENVPTTSFLREGMPELEILELAESAGASLIFLGHRSRNFLGRWLGSGVSEDVVDLAPCPVVLVNHRGTA